MRIVLTADHAGVDLKDDLAGWLAEQGHEVLDLGTHGHESVDYPRFGALRAEALADGRAERGISVCGSGIGVAIAANRNPACRCAQVAEPLSASLARQHNDANVLAIGARTTPPADIPKIVRAWFATEFEGGRHAMRVAKISDVERSR